MSANDDGRAGPPGASGPPGGYEDEPTRVMTPRPPLSPVDADEATVVRPIGPPSLPPAPAEPAPDADSAATDAEATQVLPLSRPPPEFERTQLYPPPSPAAPSTPATPAGDSGSFGHPSTFSSAGLPGHTLGSSSAAVAAAVATAGGEVPVRQVGRYLIQSRLGRGGMATVYKAHDPSIGRSVAIKFLHASLAEDEEYRARFLREARAAGGLSHPNIVVVHDVGEIEGRPYMAMELIDGEPLADVLDQRKVLPIRDVVIIGMQLARALAYAHERGIVHRDIKPGNIMVLGDSMTVKVTDFGIAHMDDGGSQRTQVGAVMGTPQYMSPEQTRGEKLDGRSDLFSAGVVLYQMLTGKRPFGGDNLVAVAARIANDAPPPLMQSRPDTPASLRRVVDRCLAKQREQRYQTGKELADALAKVLGEIDEAAREKAKPRMVSLRIKWALAMALVVAVVMGATAALITQRQYAAMIGQALESGASLARFIARQNAGSALAEDWEVVDVALQEMMKTGSFERIVVVDPAGIVRAASQGALVGQPYRPAGTQPLGALAGGTTALRYRVDGEPVLGFESPITFRDKLVGRVALGIPEKPLTQVARLSITLMAVLAVVTVAAVALATYLLGNRFAKPIGLVIESMHEIGEGRFAHRIGEKRNDEFGLLFAAFDAMAEKLQARAAAGGGTAQPATTVTPLPPPAGEPPPPAATTDAG